MMLLLGKHQFIVSSIDESVISDPRSVSSSGSNQSVGGGSLNHKSAKRGGKATFVSF